MTRKTPAAGIIRKITASFLILAFLSLATLTFVDASPNIDYGDPNDPLLHGGKIVFTAGTNQTLLHYELSRLITIQRQCLNGTALTDGENTVYVEARVAANMSQKSATAEFYDISHLPLPTSERGAELVIQNGCSTTSFYYCEATPGDWVLLVPGSDGLSPTKPEVPFSGNCEQYRVLADGSMDPFYQVGYFLSSVRTCFVVNPEPIPTSLMVPVSTVLATPRAVLHQHGDTLLINEGGVLFGVVFAVCLFIVITAASVVVLFGKKR
ncbi:MAG: hypothetical protein ACQCN6_03650 [Candidatus Bathyarchaeia archaeon]|jgi:hypothetical protein